MSAMLMSIRLGMVAIAICQLNVIVCCYTQNTTCKYQNVTCSRQLARVYPLGLLARRNQLIRRANSKRPHLYVQYKQHINRQ